MIKRVDHFVISTVNPEACLNFYSALGFQMEKESGRYALRGGDFTIHVYQHHKELYPHAKKLVPGSSDFCFEVDEPWARWRNAWQSADLNLNFML